VLPGLIHLDVKRALFQTLIMHITWKCRGRLLHTVCSGFWLIEAMYSVSWLIRARVVPLMDAILTRAWRLMFARARITEYWTNPYCWLNDIWIINQTLGQKKGKTPIKAPEVWRFWLYYQTPNCVPLFFDSTSEKWTLEFFTNSRVSRPPTGWPTIRTSFRREHVKGPLMILRFQKSAASYRRTEDTKGTTAN